MAKENTSLKNNLNVLILPNPATDQFTMQLNTIGASGKASLKISDATGKVLKYFQTSGPEKLCVLVRSFALVFIWLK